MNRTHERRSAAEVGEVDRPTGGGGGDRTVRRRTLLTLLSLTVVPGWLLQRRAGGAPPRAGRTSGHAGSATVDDSSPTYGMTSYGS